MVKFIKGIGLLVLLPFFLIGILGMAILIFALIIAAVIVSGPEVWRDIDGRFNESSVKAGSKTGSDEGADRESQAGIGASHRREASSDASSSSAPQALQGSGHIN